MPASTLPFGPSEGELNRPIGILLDLQGPKIRVGKIKGGTISVEAGEAIRFVLTGAPRATGRRSPFPIRRSSQRSRPGTIS